MFDLGQALQGNPYILFSFLLFLPILLIENILCRWATAVVLALAFTEGLVDSEKKQRGASLVEYAILLAILVLVSLAAVRAVGSGISQEFSGLSSAVS